MYKSDQEKWLVMYEYAKDMLNSDQVSKLSELGIAKINKKIGG